MNQTSRAVTQEETGDPVESPEHKPLDLTRITVSSARLVAVQRRRALIFNIVPLLGCLAAGALAVRDGVSRVDLGLLLVFYLLGFVGIEVGFHRFFSHAAFRAHRAVKLALAILGCMAAQGPVVYWASNHRRHHKYTDMPGDPHSPYVRGHERLGRLKGIWHSHMGWLFDREITNTLLFAKDLIRDPELAKVNRFYVGWVLLGFAVPALLGGLLSGSPRGALTGFLWGGLVRTFLVQHATFSINSICHLLGSRPFTRGGRSTNNPWLALVTLGGAWHHNHHVFPRSAVNTLHWWQIDAGAWLILALERLGWVWNVKRPPSQTKVEASRATPAAIMEVKDASRGPQ